MEGSGFKPCFEKQASSILPGPAVFLLMFGGNLVQSSLQKLHAVFRQASSFLLQVLGNVRRPGSKLSKQQLTVPRIGCSNVAKS